MPDLNIGNRGTNVSGHGMMKRRRQTVGEELKEDAGTHLQLTVPALKHCPAANPIFEHYKTIPNYVLLCGKTLNVDTLHSRSVSAGALDLRFTPPL